MLHHLIKYAQDHGIADEAEPGFCSKEVRWAIECDAFGRFTEVMGPLGEGRGGRRFPKCPNLTQPELVGGRELRSHFLVETAEVVALYRRDDTDEAAFQKARGKHNYFVRLLREASSVMPQLELAARMLEDSEQLEAIRDRLRSHKAKPTDKVTLLVGGEFLVASDAWHEWWRCYRRSLGMSSRGGQMVCFLTGEVVVPPRTYEKIRGLAGVGGKSTGDALVSFDKEAFASYGLEQAANAAMSEASAKVCWEALSTLIENNSKKLLSSLLVYWFKERVADPEDPIAWLMEPSEQEERSAQCAAQKLLNAIESGERPALSNNCYFAFTLSGAKGRVMVRDWMEGPFRELVTNVSAWFEDLEIICDDGRGFVPNPRFRTVLDAFTDDSGEVSPAAELALLRAALQRRSIPHALLAQAVRHASLDIVVGNTPNSVCMGLIKAFHIRNTKGGVAMKPDLNKDHPTSAYHCGRLLAVLANLQRSALGDVGAGVVQRYYIATCQAPALMIGRLVANAKNHLNKLEPGLAWWYEDEIAAIMGRIGDCPPRTLDLEGQSLFALGYYHQLAYSRSKRVDNNQNEEGGS